MPVSFDDDKAAGQIVTMYQERRSQRSGQFRRMQEIRDHYNGDVIVPLPELDEAEKPAIPNLIAQGIDAFAMRVASVLPDVQDLFAHNALNGLRGYRIDSHTRSWELPWRVF